MIEFIMMGLGLLLGATFYGVYHLYPTKRNVFPRGKTTKGDKRE